MALIYVVEDDESIREIETIALKNSGHIVSAFECAKDFFKKIDEILPDLARYSVLLTIKLLLICFLICSNSLTMVSTAIPFAARSAAYRTISPIPLDKCPESITITLSNALDASIALLYPALACFAIEI